MKTRSLVVLLPVVGLLAATRSAGAQIAEGVHYDAPTDSRLDELGARSKLLAWVEDTGSDREQHIYFRNTSDQPIQITSYEFRDCNNVSVKCRVVFEGPRLEPGETILLEKVRQRNIELRWSYQYRFTARFIRPAEPVPQAAPLPEGRASTPPEPPSGWTAERYEYVDRVMPMLLRKHSVPGVAIVLLDGAKVQWSGAYGVEHADGPAITRNTLFRAGTLGEPVLALTLMRLADARGWNLNAPISTWAFAPAIPSGLGSLSAASVLVHTGGIELNADRDGFRVGSRSPGWHYAPAGYAFLKYLIEMSEGHDLEVLVQALVTEPHHLGSMTFTPPSPGAMARGHDSSGRPLANGTVAAIQGDVPLYSSASDYARFLIEVSPLSRRDMATWYTMTSSARKVSEELGVSWARGWAVGELENWPTIVFQRDEGSGFSSLALVDADLGLGLVIMANGSNGLALAADVHKMLDPRGYRFLEFDPSQP